MLGAKICFVVPDNPKALYTRENIIAPGNISAQTIESPFARPSPQHLSWTQNVSQENSRRTSFCFWEAFFLQHTIDFKILLITFKITFKILQGLAPKYLAGLITVLPPPPPPPSHYNLRRNNDGVLLSRPTRVTKATTGDRFFEVAPPSLWNCLPLEAHTTNNINEFKRRVKSFLFRKTFHQIVFVFIPVLRTF